MGLLKNIRQDDISVVIDKWCGENNIENYDILHTSDGIVIDIKESEKKRTGMESPLQINTPPPYKININQHLVILKNFTQEFIPNLPTKWNDGITLTVYVGGMNRFPDNPNNIEKPINVGDFSWFNSLGGSLTISGYYCRCEDVEISIQEHLDCLKLIEINATLKNINTHRLVLTHSMLKTLDYEGFIGEVDMEKSFLEKEINGKVRLINLNPQIWVKMNTMTRNHPKFRTGWY